MSSPGQACKEIVPESLKRVCLVNGKVRAPKLIELTTGEKGPKNLDKILASCSSSCEALHDYLVPHKSTHIVDFKGAVLLLFVLHGLRRTPSFECSCDAVAERLRVANPSEQIEEVLAQDFEDPSDAEEDAEQNDAARRRAIEERTVIATLRSQELVSIQAALALHPEDLELQRRGRVLTAEAKRVSSGLVDAEQLLRSEGHSYSEAASMCSLFGRLLREAARAVNYTPATELRYFGGQPHSVYLYDRFDPEQACFIKVAYENLRRHPSFQAHSDPRTEEKLKRCRRHMEIANVANCGRQPAPAAVSA